VGINALYLNMQDRERNGIVLKADKRQLLEEIKEKLGQLRDPDNGQHIVSSVHISDDIYGTAFENRMPDMLIGYNRGYRCSDKSALGEFSEAIIETNLDKWSGDHCMFFKDVPGVILANKNIAKEEIFLYDLTPTILAAYRVPIPEDMIGESIFQD